MASNDEDATGVGAPARADAAPRPKSVFPTSLASSPYLRIEGLAPSNLACNVDVPDSPPSTPTIGDYRTLVQQSTSQIALFEFPNDIPVQSTLDDILARVFATSSRCLEANLVFACHNNLSNLNDAIGRPFSSFFPPDADNQAMITKWAEGNFFLSHYDRPMRGSDGKDRVVQVAIYPIFVGSAVRCFWILLRDVTETHRLLVALKQEEAHYRALVERPGLILVRARPDGSYVYVSPHVTDLTGYSADEFQKVPGLFQRLLHPEDVARHSIIYETRRQRGTRVVEVEYRVRKPDGTYHWMFERQTPKLNEHGEVEYYDSVAFDIQERKRLEAELMHAQRMETIGVLAGGIAHDFNNHLTALLGQLNLCLKALGSQHPCYEKLAAAEQAALCCGEMTKQLLFLGRKSDSDFSPLPANRLIEDTVRLLTHVLPSSIEISLSLEPNLRDVSGNLAQLQQVLMNIVVNARDAMPSGGSMSVRARNLCLVVNRDPALYPQLAPGDYVEITVTDSGEGIPATNLPHIFEPFFTTKHPGQNSGLGLSMVYTIIEEHHGAIHVASEVGIGTTFSFLLPALAQSAGAGLPKERDIETARGKECILVADDDEMVLSMVTTALCVAGYTVVKATNGIEALDLFKQHGNEIALVLLDHTMPKLSGRQLIEKIRELSPTQAIILTSGYGRHVGDLIPGDDPRLAFISKPYALPELLRQLRQMLDKCAQLG
ncbi:MAG: PAS domain S-box protein [Oligoflexia bacterium]|nr:PAS domain S-box protein [Oligoflexia bacterium]